MQKFRKNDEVIVIAGKHKGKVAKIINLDYKKNLVIVEQVQMVKKHTKPSQNNSEGGIIEKEAPIHLSNIALATKGKEKKAIKVKFVKQDGKKVRVDKKTGKEV